MKMLLIVAAIAFSWACAAAADPVPPASVARLASEPDLAFAERALKIGDDNDPHVVAAAWNGTPALFVDYQTTTTDETHRLLVGLMRRPDGAWRLVKITDGEEEGAVAQVAAIGFAATDHSRAQSLIVILTWDQNHSDLVQGTLYEVRLFAPPGAGQAAAPLLKLSHHFDIGCECDHGDGPAKHPHYQTHFAYKTIAAVKRELKRLGY